MNLLNALLRKHSHTQRRQYISTGITPLNLMLTGSCDRGIATGSVAYICGSSGSGRTSLALTILAEAVACGLCDNYQCIYNDTESQCHALAKYIGEKTNSRILHHNISDPTSFWDYIEGIDRPCIYILDSLDGLDCDGGWKIHNDRARTAFTNIRENNSILLITSQEKTVAGKSVASGGYSVPYYCDYEFSTYGGNRLDRYISGRKRTVGAAASVYVKKGGVLRSGSHRVDTPLFDGYGYDDVEAMFVFLLKNGCITVEGDECLFNYIAYKGSFAKMIEKMRLVEDDVRQFVTHIWEEKHNGLASLNTSYIVSECY